MREGTQRIVFMVAICNRYELLVRSLASLLRSDLPDDALLFLIDDHSSDPRVSRYLRDLDVSPRKKRVLTLPERTGRPAHVFNAGLERYKREYENPHDFIGWGDPDMLYAPDWYSAGMKAPALGRGHGYGSPPLRIAGFTTWWLGPRPDRHGLFVRHRDCCIKRHAPWANTVMEWNVLNELAPFPTALRPELRFAQKMERLGYCLAGTVRSYVQHIGAYQSALFHHRRGGVDIADDFVGDPEDTEGIPGVPPRV